MQRCFLEISFDGSAYHGWQVQDNATSVQGIVNDALRKVFKMPEVQTTGCGRTDTGVHASSFFLHFDTKEAIIDTEKERYRINSILPFDIACKRVIPLHDDAHSRFDATERKYEYRIHQEKDPFLNKYSTYIGYPLDVDLMNRAGQILLNQDDFASFCKSGSDQHTTICDVREASWLQEGNQLTFTIRADRFLRNMVRATVGTLVDVGRKKMSIPEFEEVLKAKSRSSAGTSVPAHGLYLTGVKYPYL